MLARSRRVPTGATFGRGFTLIELMVVIVILGILATLVMPRILDRPEKARRTKAKAQISIFQQALGLFKADTGRYPTTGEGLAALVKDPGIKGWDQKGYLPRVPLDPWGKPYRYVCPCSHDELDVVSHGRDGEPGGTGYDADIESWNLDAE